METRELSLQLEETLVGIFHTAVFTNVSQFLTFMFMITFMSFQFLLQAVDDICQLLNKE